MAQAQRALEHANGGTPDKKIEKSAEEFTSVNQPQRLAGNMQDSAGGKIVMKHNNDANKLSTPNPSVIRNRGHYQIRNHTLQYKRQDTDCQRKKWNHEYCATTQETAIFRTTVTIVSPRAGPRLLSESQNHSRCWKRTYRR
jgi:hypothetical protein